MHMKELVEGGYVGEVMAVHVSLMREGVLSRPSHRTWQRDAALGANTLTIANGHTVDAMRFVVGDFGRLSAVVATQAKQWLDTGANTLLDVTSPDNVLVSGRLAKRRSGIGPYRRDPVRRERVSDGNLRPRRNIGSDGRGFSAAERGLAARSEGRQRRSRQFLCRSALPSPRPARPPVKHSMLVKCTRCLPGLSATAKSRQPTFETAVELHRLVDAIKQASDTGREVAFV